MSRAKRIFIFFIEKLKLWQQLRIVRNEFDKYFYIKKYPEIKKSGLSPVMHFLQKGWEQGKDPNPNFSTRFYLENNLDVEAANINPFVHYLLHGKKENRLPCPVKETSINKFRIDHIPVTKAKIAVVIHGFYTDLIEELLNKTQNIPYRYDILISVLNDESKSIILNWKKDNSFRGKMVIKNIPNFGRDMYPFLITFREEIQKYDLVCKIHTKKSLYSGRENTQWRSNLINGLMGNTTTVASIFNLFEKDKELALIYPQSTNMPYWAYTWLSNRVSGNFLLNLLGITAKTEGYIDYPLGSMFWLKPKAAFQLFDGRIKPDFFEPEPLKNDGSFVHALERCLALLVKQNGYTYAEISQELNEAWIGHGLRNMSQYNHHSYNDLVKLIDNVDIVSFDIFDTLICRPYLTPDQLFINIENYLDEKYQVETGFFKKRKAAEMRANNLLKREVNFDDIYAELRNENGLDSKIIDKACKMEFALELKISLPREEGIKAYCYARNKGQRVILVTDMYLTKTQIEKLLKKHNIRDYDALYLSSELNKRKDNASMWEYLVKHEKLTDNNFAHIGDNEQSDIQLTGDRQLHNYHLMSAKHIFENTSPGQQLLENNIDNKTLSFLGPIISRIFNNPFVGKEFSFLMPKFKTPFDTGYAVFGPLAFSFCLWLCKQFEKNRYGHVYFLAREGYFLKELFEYFISFDLVKYSFQTPPVCEYLLLSRRAVLGAIEKNNEDIVAILSDNIFDGSIDEIFLNRLGIEINDLNISEKDSKLKPNDFLKKKNNDIQFIQKQINDIAIQERQLLNDYLKSMGVFNSSKTAIVDLGYNGTMQKYLYQLTGKPLNGYYFITTKKTSEWESADNLSYGHFGDKLNPDGNSLLKYSLFLESWLTSKNGQLIKFEKDPSSKQTIPVFKDKEKSKEHFHVNEEISAGVKSYIKDMLNSLLTLNKFEISTQKLDEYYRIMVKHDVWDPVTRKIFYIEDDFCGKNEVDIIKLYKSRFKDY